MRICFKGRRVQHLKEHIVLSGNVRELAVRGLVHCKTSCHRRHGKSRNENKNIAAKEQNQTKDVLIEVVYSVI